MRLHDPEAFDAHRGRSYEQLEYIASLVGLTVEQAIERNWEMTEIRNDVPPPATEAPAPKPAARRGRPRGPTKAASQAAQLQNALDFVECAVSDIMPYGEYASLANNMAVVFSGQLSAGYPIVEELTLRPHLGKLKAALARCGKTLVITETENQNLSIKGDKLRALVPCHLELMPPNTPDLPMLEGDFDALKEAFKVCGTLATEAGDKIHLASLLLEPNTCTSTNGAAMLQYWHGVNTPPGTVVSKLFAAAIAKQTKKITGLGATWNAEAGFASSLTVWFEGGAWIKTQCYNDRWPEIESILANQGEKTDTPIELFEAIEAVTPFAEGKTHKRIYFMQDFVQSHVDANVGAQYNVQGLPGGKCFDGKLIGQVAPWVKRIDLTSLEDRAHFVGGEPNNPVRGVIMCMSKFD